MPKAKTGDKSPSSFKTRLVARPVRGGVTVHSGLQAGCETEVRYDTTAKGTIQSIGR